MERKQGRQDRLAAEVPQLRRKLREAQVAVERANAARDRAVDEVRRVYMSAFALVQESRWTL